MLSSVVVGRARARVGMRARETLAALSHYSAHHQVIRERGDPFGAAVGDQAGILQTYAALAHGKELGLHGKGHARA